MRSSFALSVEKNGVREQIVLIRSSARTHRVDQFVARALIVLWVQRNKIRTRYVTYKFIHCLLLRIVYMHQICKNSSDFTRQIRRCGSSLAGGALHTVERVYAIRAKRQLAAELATPLSHHYDRIFRVLTTCTGSLRLQQFSYLLEKESALNIKIIYSCLVQ